MTQTQSDPAKGLTFRLNLQRRLWEHLAPELWDKIYKEVAPDEYAEDGCLLSNVIPELQQLRCEVESAVRTQVAAKMRETAAHFAAMHKARE